ncbi:MAG: CoA transferase [Proteobacteria bacterium]|nr:CoA transferase [Pseudomonadota bacterium]
MKAFDGITVLDFTHVIAGPFCTYQLALLGAEVIKVEAPRVGDYLRGRGGDDALRGALMGDHFACQNANKQSICIDLKTEAGAALARRMAETAEVVVENFRPGVMDALGLGYAMLSARNPRLVYCSLSGYGQDGALSERPVYDNVVQAFSGLMAMTGTASSGPLKAGAPVLDYASGTMAAFAVAAALTRRERFGAGQYLDVSMLDTAFMLMSPVISSLVNAGKAPRLHANEHALAGASCYEAADGALLMLGACTQRQFEALCRKLGREDLLRDARFADVRRQDPHRAALAAELADEIKRRDAQHWETLLTPEVPVAHVRTLAEALEESAAAARSTVTQIAYPAAEAGRLTVPVAAYRADRDGPDIDRPPPALGEDGDAVLARFGITADERARLLEIGAVVLPQTEGLRPE